MSVSGSTTMAGRWLGSNASHLLQLRLDVGDEAGALGLVSGDVYVRAGAGTGAGAGAGADDEDPDDPGSGWRYDGSFLSSVVSERLIAGRGRELTAPLSFLSRSDRYGQLVVRVWGPLPGRPESAAEAMLTIASHRRPTDAVVVCCAVRRFSRRFRAARLLVDTVVDPRTRRPYVVAPHHRIGSAPPCPAGLPARDLSIAGAFADAGIELTVETDVRHSRAPLHLPPEAHRHGLTDDELHAILTAAASREAPRGWWVHLLLAPRYAMRGVLGMVYDTDRLHPRHGTVIFVDELRAAVAVATGRAPSAVPDDDPWLTRDFLYTAVHELGHAFNLLHSFQKGWFGDSDVAPRPDAASWMNYPHLYPHGRMVAGDPAARADRFWGDFRFRFDRQELEHLRHHERDEVMMGGDAFGALGDLPPAPHAPATQCELAATLEVRAAYDHGEPFAVTLALENRGPRRLVLDLPRDPVDVVALHVRRPSGRWTRFAPLLARRESGLAWSRVHLRPGGVHRLTWHPFYGRHGFTFDEPGTYCLNATVRLPGRPPLAPPSTSLLVKNGDRALERLLAEQLFGDEQGHFLTFLGGDHLTRGRDALEALIADPRFAATRAATPVRTALAASWARSSQSFALTPSTATGAAAAAAPAPQVRPARPAEALRVLGDLVPRELLARQAAAGPAQALRVLLDTLRLLQVPPPVMSRIEPEVVAAYRNAVTK